MGSTAKKSIIITGGASGIGLGITRHFAPDPNTHVSIFDINASTGSEVLSALRTEFPSGASLSFVQCDVSSWESQADAFEKVYAGQGRIDVVFANAGISKEAQLIETDRAKKGEKPTKPDLMTLNVNLVGCLYSTKLAIHYISKNNAITNPATNTASKGTIICTASNAGIYGFPVAPIYAASKSGVIGLVRGLARPLEREQIQINALAPAVIQTNIAPSQDLFKHMILTPMETATKAVKQFLDDPRLTGKVAELHGEVVSFAEAPPYVDEDTGKNIETFWSLGYA
ncbi:short chain dehydrogenase/reductase [Paecilomyces variotii No. 5]|uniref:Short chain dehydrogenase/reductase n=1 Tax=Byssochlamys spectabilis (strain No. 5 / NBRC 109023) TaxID=1356009 RepID=V5HQQ4_BYSSN|nr:short chain dehydrogenase/reductase [Paecilomyces variotii No. 5]